MFNLSFYVICWLLVFLLCLPIVFSGLFAVAFENDGTIEKYSLSQISAELDKHANDKNRLKGVLESFLANYKVCDSGDKDYALWLDIISRFAVNMTLMEVDEVVNFQDDLESANPSNKDSIKKAIGESLQKREAKK